MTEDSIAQRPGVEYDDWRGLYKDRWNRDEIEPIALSHPAKFARALIRKIYQHCRDEGWISKGAWIVDPFGGVGLGALDAITHGENWVGVEIEKKHQVRGAGGLCSGEVIEIDNEKTLRHGWYIVVHDDMGNLQYGDANMVFGETGTGSGFTTMLAAEEAWNEATQDGPQVEVAPIDFEFLKVEFKTFKEKRVIPALCGERVKHQPHHIEGNIPLWERLYSKWFDPFGKAVLIQGDSRYLVKVLRDNAEAIGYIRPDLATSSPPFLQTTGGTNVTSTDGVLSDPRLLDRHSAGNAAAKGYGDSQGQIEAMPEGNYDQAVSSPPFDQINHNRNANRDEWFQENGDPDKLGGIKNRHYFGDYGNSPGNLDGMPSGVGDFEQATSSPPYNLPFSQEHNGSRGGERGTEPSEDGAFVKYGSTPGQIEGLPGDDNLLDMAVSSPPYADIAQSGGDKGLKDRNIGLTQGEAHFAEYGENDGQLGRMSADMSNFDMATTSPVYADTRITGQGDEGDSGLKNPDGSYVRGHEGWEKRKELGGRYGEDPGQLANMESNDSGFHLAASSPPFESTLSDRPSESIVAGGLRMGASSMGDGYGETPGNIGNQNGEDFWSASRMILENLFLVLKENGHATFVLKKYVKGGKIVDFPEQWCKLCEAVGFKLVHWHYAWVVEEKGTQFDLFGGSVTYKTERKSFFRKLAEKKGSPRIDFEEVLCFERGPLSDFRPKYIDFPALLGKDMGTGRMYRLPEDAK